MTSIIVCIVLSLMIDCMIAPALGQTFQNDDVTITLDLVNHQPCHHKSGSNKWTRKLEFEKGFRGQGPQLMPRPGYPGCFTIGGQVTIYEDINRDLNVYVEIRDRGKRKSIPYRCVNPSDDGCDKGIGSCLYCNPCRTVEKHYTNQAQLLRDGRVIRCGETIRRGTYDNIQLSFCAPKLDEIIRAQDMSKQTFLSLLKTEDGQSLRNIGMHVKVYVFDMDVSGSMATQHRVEKVYRSKERIFFKDETLPAHVYWTLPFNRMIQEQRQYIACHNINADIHIQWQQG